MTTYAAILLQDAQALNPDAPAMTFAPVPDDDEDSVFNYLGQ